MVWEHRPIADEILAPRAKPPTATGTPPKYGSGIIGGLGPPFTSSVDCEEPVKMIQSSSEDVVRVNHSVAGFEKGAKISQSQSGVVDRSGATSFPTGIAPCVWAEGGIWDIGYCSECENAG